MSVNKSTTELEPITDEQVAEEAQQRRDRIKFITIDNPGSLESKGVSIPFKDINHKYEVIPDDSYDWTSSEATKYKKIIFHNYLRMPKDAEPASVASAIYVRMDFRFRKIINKGNIYHYFETNKSDLMREWGAYHALSVEGYDFMPYIYMFVDKWYKRIETLIEPLAQQKSPYVYFIENFDTFREDFVEFVADIDRDDRFELDGGSIVDSFDRLTENDADLVESIREPYPVVNPKQARCLLNKADYKVCAECMCDKVGLIERHITHPSILGDMKLSFDDIKKEPHSAFEKYMDVYNTMIENNLKEIEQETNKIKIEAYHDSIKNIEGYYEGLVNKHDKDIRDHLIEGRRITVFIDKAKYTFSGKDYEKVLPEGKVKQAVGLILKGIQIFDTSKKPESVSEVTVFMPACMLPDSFMHTCPKIYLRKKQKQKEEYDKSF